MAFKDVDEIVLATLLKSKTPQRVSHTDIIPQFYNNLVQPVNPLVTWTSNPYITRCGVCDDPGHFTIKSKQYCIYHGTQKAVNTND